MSTAWYWARSELRRRWRVSLAFLVGLPAGSALGRWSWRSLAVDVGILPDPFVPAVTVTALVAALLIVSLVLTVVPERRAAAHRPVDHLRDG